MSKISTTYDDGIGNISTVSLETDRMMTVSELTEWFDDTALPGLGFLKMEEKECAHEGYSFKEHGRCCPRCGEFSTDFGD